MASRLEDLQRSFARHLRAEGRSERTVAIYGQSVRLFCAWRWSHLDALFITQRGALSPDGARDRIALRGRQAGIQGLHPHPFRAHLRP